MGFIRAVCCDWRTAHTNHHFHTNLDTNDDPYGDFHQHRNTDAVHHSHPHPDPNPYSDAVQDADTHQNQHTDENTNPDTNTYTDTNPNAVSYQNAALLIAELPLPGGRFERRRIIFFSLFM